MRFLPASRPRDTAIGDEMILWAYENSVVLNYHRAGESLSRRFVTGPLKFENGTTSQVRLWTPEGEKIFSLVRIEKTIQVEGYC